MTLSTYVLVLFFKYGWAGGVVTIDMPNLDLCQTALAEARKDENVKAGSSFCLRR